MAGSGLFVLGPKPVVVSALLLRTAVSDVYLLASDAVFSKLRIRLCSPPR